MAFGGRRHDHLYAMGSLNAIPGDFDMTMQQQQQQQQQDGYSIQAELDMFTNAQFFDFDMGDMPDAQQPLIDGSTTHPSGTNSPHNIDYVNDFHFSNFNNGIHSHNHSQPPLTQTLQSQPQFAQRNNSSSASSPGALSPQQGGEKRKTEEPQSLEEASRLAAEEDKRRRNTAASARFRVKKKQREQALEKTAKEMTDRVNYLESRVGQLEMENKLLKDLITEKSGKEVDIAELRMEMSEYAKSSADESTSSGSTVKAELEHPR